MTRQEIAALACRIIAVWLFCQAALSIYGVVVLAGLLIPDFISRGYDSRLLAGTAVSGLMGLGSALPGAFLWWKSGRIGIRMTSADPTPVTSSNLDRKTVLGIAFTAVGAFIALQVIPDIIRPLFFVVGGDATFDDLWSNAEWQARFWTNMAQLALSLWFVFGSRGIANMVMRFRPAGGTNRASEDS